VSLVDNRANRGQVHRDVAYINHHTDLHHVAVSHFDYFQGMANFNILNIEGLSNKSHNDAGINIPNIQCILFITRFSEYSQVHENCYGHTICGPWVH